MSKYALITGASRGIGKAAALLFAARDYHVFLTCRCSADALEEVKREIISTGGACDTVTGDVGDSADVDNIFSFIYSRCSSLDVLINNAGCAHIGLLSDMTDEEWNRVIQTNLSSVFYCSRAAIPPMVRRKSGTIVNVSSMWGTYGASCEAAYSASKSGVNGLTKALAKELAPSNVQVNALACGVIDTEMNSQLSVEERAELADEIPAGRFGTPEEAAEMLWNIATAPSYMTGQIIGIDGGF
ncbi:3-oxoacyl-ACP reductase FabG [Dorea sp. D27]|uniref:3-oxoacyl-ACP reductase FabG n=1 Tax=Dorea sp. D27 TaxID=658665 RepID=UPI00067394A0|nr:3-oxoacyl-ACP reductase FabG [Dorea sp. D27]KMZ55805.1 3-oxoacyl-[acyl-carrier-protein] reductase [Dorea sp. D27]